MKPPRNSVSNLQVLCLKEGRLVIVILQCDILIVSNLQVLGLKEGQLVIVVVIV